MVEQILLLRLVIQSETVTSAFIFLHWHGATGSEARECARLQEALPLLLVRVCQDAMVEPLSINSTLSVSLKLEKLLQEEPENVNAHLATQLRRRQSTIGCNGCAHELLARRITAERA